MTPQESDLFEMLALHALVNGGQGDRAIEEAKRITADFGADVKAPITKEEPCRMHS